MEQIPSASDDDKTILDFAMRTLCRVGDNLCKRNSKYEGIPEGVAVYFESTYVTIRKWREGRPFKNPVEWDVDIRVKGISIQRDIEIF